MQHGLSNVATCAQSVYRIDLHGYAYLLKFQFQNVNPDEFFIEIPMSSWISTEAHLPIGAWKPSLVACCHGNRWQCSA